MPVYSLESASIESATSSDGRHGRDSRPLEPVESSASSRSIQAKQTSATLAETFSSGDEDAVLHKSFLNESSVQRGSRHIDTHYRAGNSRRSIDTGEEDWEGSSVGSETCRTLETFGSQTLNTNNDATVYSEIAGNDQKQEWPLNGRGSSSYSTSKSVESEMNHNGTSTQTEESDSDDSSSPIHSFASSESGSSWEGSACSASRDVSLLDSADSQDVDSLDDASYDDESCTDDEEVEVTPTLTTVLQNMKNCNLNGASLSFEDEKNTDFQFILPVATQNSGGENDKKRSKGKLADAESLFSRMSALGEEFMGSKDGKEGKRQIQGRRTPRRKRIDPTLKIIDSLVSFDP